MIKFRISIVLLCVILPPVLYIGSIQFLERHGQNRLQAALESTYLGDTRRLLDGSLDIRQAIPHNIEHTLARSRWLTWGGKASVTVRTGQNTLLYPATYEDLTSGPDLARSALDLASENFRIISEGLELTLDFNLPHTSLLANLILAVYILAALSGLFIYYRRWSDRFRQENRRRTEELERLSRSERLYHQRIVDLQGEHKQMAADLEQMKVQLKEEKKKADASEEEMLEEIINLEEQIQKKETRLAQQLEEMSALEDKLANLEAAKQKESNRKSKPADMARKRLTTLYKRLDIHDRAIEGYIDLTEEFKIKAEEVMMQLNEDPAAVNIKRKVFGKKNRITVLEVVFGYKGRLYFRIKADHQAELLTIGTKNSQQQDLAYLDKL